MTVFRVGQRVRIKWSNCWPELAGRTGTITRATVRTLNSDVGCEWDVTPDGFESNLLPCASSPDGAAYFCPNSSQLEPLTDSYDLVSWESMRDLWVPEHLREVA